MLRSRLLGLVGAMTLSLVLTACGSGDNDNTAGGTASDKPVENAKTEITVGSFSEPVTLDPQKEDDDAGYAVWWRLYEPLFDSDAKGAIQPVLAAGPAEQVEPTTWEVKLREGVKFHGGEPFNADSAVFSIERVIDKEFETTIGEIAGITGAEKVDETTIRVKTAEPDFLLPRRLEAVVMVPKDAKNLEKEPNGTGPYTMESFDSASQAVLAANAEYWGDEPKVKKVTVRFISDPGTRLQSLQAGEIDLALNMAPDQAPQMPTTIGMELATQTGFARVNTLNKNSITSDPRVREALNLAIDREGIAESLYSGYAEPEACQVGPPWVGGRSETLKPVPHDPERAKQLIEEAGATGKTITMQWPSGVFAQDRALGEAVAQAWESIGLKPDLKLLSYNPFVKAIFTLGADVEDVIFTELNTGLAHAERQIARVFYTDEGVSSYSNPEVDRLRKTALGTTDEAEREEAFAKINEITCEEWGGVYILHRKEIMGAVEGTQYTPRPPISTKVYYEDVQVPAGT